MSVQSDATASLYLKKEHPVPVRKLAESQKRSGYFAGKIKLTTPASLYQNAVFRSAVCSLVNIDYTLPHRTTIITIYWCYHFEFLVHLSVQFRITFMSTLGMSQTWQLHRLLVIVRFVTALSSTALSDVRLQCVIQRTEILSLLFHEQFCCFPQVFLH